MFKDHIHAGEVLLELLELYLKWKPNIFIIPNGGVPVAIPLIQRIYEENLGIKHYLLPVKKIKIPNRTAGFGAITLEGEVLLNKLLVSRMKLSASEIERLVKSTLEEIETRKQEYKIKNQIIKSNNKIAIIIDEGLPTGITMMAAIKSLKKYNPSKMVVAIPTASSTAIKHISPLVETIVCPYVRDTFYFSTAASFISYAEFSNDYVKNFLDKYPIQHEFP